jgi:hypothetical protein
MKELTMEETNQVNGGYGVGGAALGVVIGTIFGGISGFFGGAIGQLYKAGHRLGSFISGVGSLGSGTLPTVVKNQKTVGV